MDSTLRRLASRIIPFELRVEFHRWRRWLADRNSGTSLAAERDQPERYAHVLARAHSPLERVPGAVDRTLQQGKEANVALAAASIDGVILEPGQLFSYHKLVGRPSRLRGFRLGLELRDNRESAGVGGGCCQVSNLLYWLALNAGLDIVERHRHGFDLFPDHQRTVPFGCGATVFYNYRDLRFGNPLDQALLVELAIRQVEGVPSLFGALRTRTDPGWRVAVEEEDHRFFEQDGQRMRENRIRRRIVDRDGSLIEDRELAHNVCRVKY